MLEEVALTPNVFLGDNSFLNWLPPEIIFSNYYNAKWERAVVSIIVNMPQGDKRNRLQKLLTRWRKQKRLIYRPTLSAKSIIPENDEKWAHEAFNSHCCFFPLNAIVMPGDTRKKINEKSPIIYTIDTYSDINSEKREKGKKFNVKRTPENYSEKLTPLFRYARMLKLVDYCIDPRNTRYKKSLREIFKAFFKNNYIPKYYCELHLTTKNITDISHDKIKDINAFKEIVPNGKSVDVFVWENSSTLPNNEKLHNRFILTDIIGIFVGKGLDVDLHSPGNDDWAILNRGSLEEHSNEFCKNSSSFNLLTSFTIKG